MATVHEQCACGATFDLTYDDRRMFASTSADRSLQEWRDGHRHNVRPGPTPTRPAGTSKPGGVVKVDGR